MDVIYESTANGQPSLELHTKPEEVRYAEPPKIGAALPTKAAAAAAAGGEYEDLYEAMSSARAFRSTNNTLHQLKKPEELSADYEAMQFAEPEKHAKHAKEKSVTFGEGTRIDKSDKSEQKEQSTAKIFILFAVLLTVCFVTAVVGIIIAASVQYSYTQLLHKQETTKREVASLIAMLSTVPSLASTLNGPPVNNLSVITDAITPPPPTWTDDGMSPTTSVPAQPSWSCYTETANSSLGDNGNYRNRYETPEITTQIAGRETVSMSCQYSNTRSYTVVTFMRGSQGRVRCYCDVFNFISSQPARATLASDLQLECVLSVTRCYQT